ncbi:hypothetical protein [Longispora albida]|uniref:hypothetical protein n=1 Tax=Longispora albida TaxID=203523 RepID=UPI00036DB16A|nr:hypothetical protein [Longispora albida]
MRAPRATLACLPLAALALTLTLAGCDLPSSSRPSATPVPSPPASQSATRVPAEVIIVITGGIAGRSDMWTIAPDGSWRHTDPSGAKVKKTGKLTGEQLQELTSRVHSPALKAEFDLPGKPGTCPDGITMVLRSGPVSGVVPSCGVQGPMPRFGDLTSFVQRVTT